MIVQDDRKHEVERLLANLCSEAIVDGFDSDRSVIFYSRSPKGKAFAEEATTIALTSKGYGSLRELVTLLGRDKQLRLEFSKKELEQELITSLFEGVKAQQDGVFDVQMLIDSLTGRLQEDRETRDVYVPIEGLDLPDNERLSLAGGMFGTITDDEKSNIRDQCAKIWNESTRQSGSTMHTLSQYLDETLESSKMWYLIQTRGRQDGAKNQAIEAAQLAMDILAFFALVNGINPEEFACNFPHRSPRSVMRSFQMVKGGPPSLESEIGYPFTYRLDSPRFKKLIALKEFYQIQAISNCNDISPVQQKFLFAVQQYAEATRLPSLSAKLVWYLSALETVLLKEREQHATKAVIKKRLGKLIGSDAAKRVDALYQKRRQTIHYGNRAQIRTEFIAEADVHDARSLSYLGIILALKHSDGFLDVDRFLNSMDGLPAARNS